ncbi:unnamed protein product [Thlaspi arvense]|uniref:Uncharacterized protein n=1 Tax=Thlaspi arvense TaxID=13288 RepID=A0AAU9RRA5_THLAR|nr:unnamed protein product [Thlaspi arvense]
MMISHCASFAIVPEVQSPKSLRLLDKVSVALGDSVATTQENYEAVVLIDLRVPWFNKSAYYAMAGISGRESNGLVTGKAFSRMLEEEGKTPDFVVMQQLRRA